MWRLVPKLGRVFKQAPTVSFLTLDTSPIPTDRSAIRERSKQVMNLLRDLRGPLGLDGMVAFLDVSRDAMNESKVLVHAHVLVAGDFDFDRMKKLWRAKFGPMGPEQFDIASANTLRDAKRMASYSLKLFTTQKGVFGTLEDKDTFRTVARALKGIKRSQPYGIFHGSHKLHRNTKKI